MRLIIDIGNSFCKIAVFDSNELAYFEKFTVCDRNKIEEIALKYGVENVILSSVKKEDPELLDYLNRNFKFLIFNSESETGIKNHYKTPHTLGTDRLAGVVAASNIFVDENVLVIDAGTCITFDFIDKEKNYWGGNISPGVEMRLKALNEFTSNLPLVSRSANKDILGKTTEEALQNGVIWGIKSEIEGFIQSLTAQSGELRVILTGGDAGFFAEILESKIFVDSYLIVRGLNDILIHNEE